MSELDLVVRLASDVFERHCSPAVVSAGEAGWSPALWDALEHSGLTTVGLDEDHAGSGGGWPEIAAVLRVAGRSAAPVPLAETVLAGRLLAAAGIAIPDGPLTLAPTAGGSLELAERGGSAVLRGRARRVPWASASAAIVTVVDQGDRRFVAVVPSSLCRIAPGLNMAREPRDTVTFDDIDLGALAHAELARDGDVHLDGALSRAIQMAGALERVLQLTADYVNVRQQFGRPIGRFQAVQQNLAILSAEVAAASAAADAAVAAAHAADGTAKAYLTEVAVAKVRVGLAASEGARIAHQIHGAIGVTYEHQLHHFTSRLWSWRDEFGGEREWAIRLGHAVAGSGAGYWDRLTQSAASP